MKIGFKIVRLALFLFVTGTIISSCMKRPDYPDYPIIKFKAFIPEGDSAKLIFEFTDGDGDIGLRKEDTIPPYDANLFLKYYEQREGEFVEVEPIIPFNYRIPDISRKGKIKTLEGEIMVRINYYYDFASPYDTIKYSAYIVDRALNKSNVIETDPIVVQK
jgi:hypothetical protein